MEPLERQIRQWGERLPTIMAPACSPFFLSSAVEALREADDTDGRETGKSKTVVLTLPCPDVDAGKITSLLWDAVSSPVQWEEPWVGLYWGIP